MPKRGCRSLVASEEGDWRRVLSVQPEHPDADMLAAPEDGQLLVDVISAGLAFPDVLTVEGKHIMSKAPPFVPANEVCGRVTAVGPECEESGFAVGDLVCGVAVTGSMAERAIMLAEQTYRVPAGVDPNVAAGLEVNYGTTWHGLVDLAQIQSGETLLVLGASGGVGMAAIDIGKARGARVVACASTAAKLAACKAAGADVLVNYASDGGGDFKAALKEHGVYGEVDVVYDPVGGKFSEVSFRAMGWGGRFLVVGFASGGATPKDAIPRLPLNLALLNERQVMGVFWGSWKARDGNEVNRRSMETMFGMIASGKLKPVVSKVYPLLDYAKAFDDMMSRRVVGKVCIEMGAGGSRL